MFVTALTYRASEPDRVIASLRLGASSIPDGIPMRPAYADLIRTAFATEGYMEEETVIGDGRTTVITFKKQTYESSEVPAGDDSI